MWETALTKSNDPKVLIGFISCLSAMEENAFLFYKAFSDKIEIPMVKSFLLSIAVDSHKHSMLLKGIVDSMAKQEKPKDCAKKTGEAWQIIDTLYREISAKEKIPESELSQMSEKLAYLESIMGEEYYVFVQLKTLQLLVKEIAQLYNIDLGGVKNIFAGIINDEERHRELLVQIKEVINSKVKAADNSPAVKYQNPDSWINSLPPTS